MRRSPFIVFNIILAIVFGSGVFAEAGDVFRRGRFVKQISASPFAKVVTTETDETDSEWEPHIAVDPADPSIVVAVVQQGQAPYRTIGVATSHDGGRTWTSGSLPALTAPQDGPFERATDPVVAFGPDGTVYAQTLAIDGPSGAETRSSVVVQRSDDGGLTFGSPMLIQDDQGAPLVMTNDKNWIAVDGFPSSPHYGRIYSAWTRFTAVAPGVNYGQIVLRHSDDRGATWSDLVAVSANYSMIGAQPVVQPNGDLSVVYSSYDPCGELSQTSHDGGEHFDAPVTIATCTSREAIPGMRTSVTKYLAFPSAAIDPMGGPSGLLYVVWEDGELRPDGLHAIALSVSSDGGTTWTAPRTVGSVNAVQRFTPAVAAWDRAVVVSFRSRVPDKDRVFMRYVASADAGANFGRERKLGKAGNLQFAATVGDNLGAVDLLFLGDYMGLAMSADAAHAVWCRPSRPRKDSPSLHHQTTWSATIPR